jgi:cellulose synthase (UDP-forming)
MSLLGRIPLLRSIIPPREHTLRYMDDEERGNLIRARLLAIGTVIAGLVYLGWLFYTVNPHHPWLGGSFIAAETLCLLLFITASFTVWGIRHKPPEGLPIAQPPSVDIFVTVCGEPLDIVSRTLQAVSAIEWPGRRTVYVLDDGGSVEVELVAHGLDFAYHSRRQGDTPLEGAKAGNLNFGLTQSDGDLVLVLDADQVPQPQILLSLAGYMRFPDVGFIQSRQFYLVPDGDPFFSLDRVFYQAVQLGYDHRDNAISCGSGVVYRRAALNDSDGFASWNLVEDLTTSYELHSRGWRSFYYPYPVTVGLAPSEIWGVYRQRGQWALDTMRLFVWDNPLLKRGLRWQSRMSYLVIPLAYLGAGFVFPFLFTIPAWTYLTGSSVLAGSETQFVILRGIYFVMMAIALRALFRKQQAGRQFQMLVGLFPIYLIGALRSLFYPPRRGPQYVPNHAARVPTRRPAFVAILPQLALLSANAVLPFYAIFADTAAPRLILSNAFISAAAIWSLLPTIFAALTKKVWAEQENPYGTYRQPAETDT